MSPKRTLSLWIIVSVFFVTAAMVPLSRRLLRRPADPPSTLAELSKLLSGEAPSFYVVPVNKDHLESGIYICTQPQPLEQLMWLLRSPKAVRTSRHGKWQGVAYCERLGTMSLVDYKLQTWGEHGMRIGSLLFFGDPQLLRRIHKTIFDHQGSKAVPN